MATTTTQVLNLKLSAISQPTLFSKTFHEPTTE